MPSPEFTLCVHSVGALEITLQFSVSQFYLKNVPLFQLGPKQRFRLKNRAVSIGYRRNIPALYGLSRYLRVVGSCSSYCYCSFNSQGLIYPLRLSVCFNERFFCSFHWCRMHRTNMKMYDFTEILVREIFHVKSSAKSIESGFIINRIF